MLIDGKPCLLTSSSLFELEERLKDLGYENLCKGIEWFLNADIQELKNYIQVGKGFTQNFYYI